MNMNEYIGMLVCSELQDSIISYAGEFKLRPKDITCFLHPQIINCMLDYIKPTYRPEITKGPHQFYGVEILEGYETEIVLSLKHRSHMSDCQYVRRYPIPGLVT